MKTIYLQITTVIIVILLSVFILLPKDHTSTTFKAQLDLFKEYPNEWMYNQRAYPNNFINAEAIKNAIEQSLNIIKNRQGQGTGDWELEGPINTGGRITDVAISPDNDDILYVGTATGGIFKTTDRGDNWTPIFDAVVKPSIGNIAIAPSNSQRIYVGTGEANGSATDGAYFGDGIYRSDDGGDTWNNMGLEESNHIGRIIIDPTDSDRVFVAATGKLYGYNEERGIYRSTNGGNDWERVLFITDSTSAIDVIMNPVNTDIIFAAMWERTRKPWQRDYGGITSAIHRSIDGGDNWEILTNGLPAVSPNTGRISLAISESEPSTIYARYTTNEITNVFDGLYKSTDNGDSWTLVALGDISGVDSSFGWYFGNIRINPLDPDEVYVLGQQLVKTSNSGSSWQTVSGMHVDHHAMEYSKNNNNFILAGNDGGAYISENGGNSWTHFNNLPITQFYNIEVDFQQPERLYGGTQDNNTIRTLTGSNDDWSSIWGGDGFHVNVDPNDNNFVYAESQFGGLGRSTNGGTSFQGATDGIDFNDRRNWNTPVVLSPFDSEIVFYGSNKLYTSDKAVFWTAISPDLTDGQHPSGSLSYGTLTAIAPSYLNLDTVYVGSDDGNVNVTFNGGNTWENITNGLPDRYITSIAISHNDDQIAYITFSGFSVLDYTPHIFKTEDGGQNWSDISSNLPSIPVNDIILFTNSIFVATDLNVWYSENDGVSWDIVGNDLPFTIIRDLKLHEPSNMLFAGTFGRSLHSYDLDNLILGTIENSFQETSIKIYPIPSKTNITIVHNFDSEGAIYLYDITGKKIKSLFNGNLLESQELSFSIEDIPAGIYFVKFETNNRSITKKIIKR
ncbi:MAG: T9SS type A sorting domain-containing protein [Bacteroidetes bacterium]|nr:T9SS type A sorting domain-containing protein [Bacteroidota bacterium]